MRAWGRSSGRRSSGTTAAAGSRGAGRAGRHKGFALWAGCPSDRAKPSVTTLFNEPNPRHGDRTGRAARGRAGPRAARVLVVRAAWLLVLLLAGAATVPRAAAQASPSLPPASELKKMSVEELLDMVVTSVSKRPEQLLDVASAIQVVTGDDVARSGAATIPEALRLASNLEVAQIDSRQWAITARGFDDLFSNKLLVLIDGRSVYTPLYGGVYWDVQDTFLPDLDRIEAISGPGATQWGADAVNGVINITTKSAKDTQGGLVYGGGGTELRDFGGVRYGGELGKGVYYRIYSKYTDTGDSVNVAGQGSQDAWHTAQSGFRVDREGAGGSVVTVQGDIYQATMGQIGPDAIQAKGANLLGRWSDQLGENSDARIQVYYDRTHRSIPGSFTQTLGTYDTDFQYHLRAGEANDIVSGFGFRRDMDHIINTPAEAFIPAVQAQDLYNAFAQDDITLARDRWHLTLGSKVEHNDYTGFEFEPSARATWTPTRNQTAWVAVSRAVRTPTRIDVDLYEPATPPYQVAGGPGVVSEKLVAYELGYRVQAGPRLALSASTFLNDYNDLTSFEPLNPPAPFPVVRSSDFRGRSVGAELTADWRVTDGWRLRAGYTELRVKTEPEPGTLDRNIARNVAHDPNQQGSLHSLWDLAPGWELDAEGRAVGAISNQGVPGYAEAGLRLSWRPVRSLELSVDGRNLLHAQHAEFNPVRSRREIPRSVYGEASWQF